MGIHHMDCLEGMHKIPNGSVHCIATDPPYGVSYVTNHRKYDDKDIARPIDNDQKFDADWFAEVFKECHRILADNTHIYVFGSDEVIGEMKAIASKLFTFKNILVWDKKNTSAGDLEGQYGKQAEFILFCHKGRRLLSYRPSSVVSVPRIPPDRMVHSCQKPVSLMAYFIEPSTKRGEVVCDPFLGSGSTFIAARNLGREFIGFETDPKTFAVARNRIRNDSLQTKLF